MNIGQIFKVLLGRSWIVIGTVLLTTCLTFLLNSGKDDLLRARSTLLIDFQQPTSDIALAPQLQEGYLATQAEIISSPRVAEYVINKMNVTRGEDYWNQFEEDKNNLDELIKWAIEHVKTLVKSFGEEATFEEEEDLTEEEVEKATLARTITDQLRVKARDNTRLIDIIYISRDQDFAIEMANVFADAYVKINLELNTASARRNAEWMNDQLAGLRAKLDSAQRRLTDYEMQTGILANDGRASIELTHLSELTGQLATAQAEAEFAGNKLVQLGNLEDIGANLNSIPEVMGNSFFQELKSELHSKENELVELSTEIGRNHPDFIRKTAEIENLKNDLKAQISVIAEGIRNQAALAKSKVEALTNAQAEQKNKLLEGKETSSDLPALVREIENAQRSYESALQRYEEYNLQSRITQTNAAVLSYSEKANRAKIPTMARNLTLATILGFILGCGIVLLLEIRSPLIRSESDLAGLDLTYLGKINAG